MKRNVIIRLCCTAFCALTLTLAAGCGDAGDSSRQDNASEVKKPLPQIGVDQKPPVCYSKGYKVFCPYKPASAGVGAGTKYSSSGPKKYKAF